MLYNWQFFDKRNRLTHNMIMEHFELHKENLEDLLIEVDKHGPKVFVDLTEDNKVPMVTLDDFALIDEISGLNLFLDNFMQMSQASETQKERVRARMVRYSGSKSKEIAMNELRMKLSGDTR